MTIINKVFVNSSAMWGFGEALISVICTKALKLGTFSAASPREQISFKQMS